MVLKTDEENDSDRPQSEAGAAALALAQSHVPVEPPVLRDAKQFARTNVGHGNRVAAQTQATQSIVGRSTR